MRTKKVAATKLPVAMTGRASEAKAALGDEPVFAYIRSLPEPQRGIAERIDALAQRTLPKLQRCIKWGMAWYGVLSARRGAPRGSAPSTRSTNASSRRG